MQLAALEWTPSRADAGAPDAQSGSRVMLLIVVGWSLLNLLIGSVSMAEEALYLAFLGGAFVDTYFLTAQLVWLGALTLGFFGLASKSQLPASRQVA